MPLRCATPLAALLILVAGAVGSASVAAAQTRSCPEQGDWVRIILRNAIHPDVGSGRFLGRVVALSDSTIAIRAAFDSPVHEFRRADIHRLDLRTGGMPRSDAAAWGGMIGLGAAGFMGLMAALDSEGNELITPFGVTLIYGILLVPIGIVAGAAIGPGETWETCSATDLRFGAVRTANGGGLAVSLRF